MEVEDWKWATIFIEIALRAARRVHFDHGMWGIGRQWQMSRLKADRINMGPGIELADERTVCAAITQEFINSPSMTGLWVEENSEGARLKEERFFTVEREVEYSDKSKKVDIFVKKYRNPGLELVPAPSFIEAKRARRWVPDILDGSVSDGGLQHIAVQQDIDKLREEMRARRDAIHCHLLIWGVYRESLRSDHPLEFFKKFDELVKVHQLRWLPVEWTRPSLKDIRDSAVEIPNVSAALWVALAEVFQLS